jgi:hypothetical protein
MFHNRDYWKEERGREVSAIANVNLYPEDVRTDHDKQHCYHHVPTVNQKLLLLQLISS